MGTYTAELNLYKPDIDDRIDDTVQGQADNGDLLEDAILARRLLSDLYVEYLIVPGTAVLGVNVMPPGIRIGRPTTLRSLYLRAGTAPTGADLTVVVKRLTTVVGTVAVPNSLTAGSTTGLTVSLAAGDILTFDVTTIGSATPGAALALALSST